MNDFGIIEVNIEAGNKILADEHSMVSGSGPIVTLDFSKALKRPTCTRYKN